MERPNKTPRTKTREALFMFGSLDGESTKMSFSFGNLTGGEEDGRQALFIRTEVPEEFDSFDMNEVVASADENGAYTEVFEDKESGSRYFDTIVDYIGSLEELRDLLNTNVKAPGSILEASREYGDKVAAEMKSATVENAMGSVAVSATGSRT